MKALWVCGLAALFAGNALAADYSVALVARGIDLYSITGTTVSLVAGSPFRIAPSGGYPLTAVMAAMNSEHNFVYALYENASYEKGGPTPLTVVGFEIDPGGLHEKWSYSVGDIDPTAYALESITAGAHYVVLTYVPDHTTPYTATLLNQSGQVVTSQGAAQVNDLQPISLTVAPDERFAYLCYLTGKEPPYTEQVVSVFELARGVFDGTASPPFQSPKLIETSSNPVFVSSECD